MTDKKHDDKSPETPIFLSDIPHLEGSFELPSLPKGPFDTSSLSDVYAKDFEYGTDSDGMEQVSKLLYEREEEAQAEAAKEVNRKGNSSKMTNHTDNQGEPEP